MVAEIFVSIFVTKLFMYMKMKKKTALFLMVMLAISLMANSKTEETNMLRGNAEIVKCPYCGKEKELMTLVSGNTFGAQFWSDNKRIAPMLPTVSPIQKCPRCKKYYFERKNRHGESKKTSSERGELTFIEWKEAYRQFVTEKISGKDEVDMCFWLIQSYNDHYYRNHHAHEPTKADYAFFVKIVLTFIKNFDWNQVDPPLLKAEFYREAGRMTECANVLKSIPYKSLKDFEKRIYNDIKKRMTNNDIKVFKLSE